MKVLIGITSKNRASILPKAIHSALRQSYVNKEVWVFDDASTDDTALLESEYPQVKWIISEKPKGLVYARNLFMNNPDFDFFCSLDDDAWFLDNNALKNALEIFEKDSKIAALGFDMLSPDNPNKKDIKLTIQETNNFIGCGHIVRLKAAKEINFYTLNPGFYGGEEKDLCIRLIDAGYKVVAFKGVYVWHDKTNLSRNLKHQHQSGVCNDLVFSYRRTPGLILAPVLILQVIKHLKFSMFFKEDKLLKPCLYGMKDFCIWATSKQTNRKAISMKGFRNFVKLKQT